jgi:isopentenyl phosphate kinase
VADAAIQINRIVIQQFIKDGIPAVSFAPASMILTRDQKPKSVNFSPLTQALNLGFLPVIYGDIIFDEKRGVCIYSAEKNLALLAQKLSKQYSSISLIFCGDTDGVYDDDKKTIPVITPRSFSKLKKFITGSAKTDVTGGMLHKVEESVILAKKGFPTTIIDGHKEGELQRAILGQKHSGTLITTTSSLRVS